jgi:hypothetical protein
MREVDLFACCLRGQEHGLRASAGRVDGDAMTAYKQFQSSGLGAGDSITITFPAVWLGSTQIPPMLVGVAEFGVTDADLVAAQAQIGTIVKGFAPVEVFVQNQAGVGSDSWYVTLVVFDGRGQAIGL